MSKLMRANFARLWKSKVFWIGIIVMFAIGLDAVFSRFDETMNSPDTAYTIDGILFINGPFTLMVAAVFVGLFVGTEYSDGTIRNKLVVGQSRWAVFFSNLIVVICAVLIMHLTYTFVVVCIGFPLLGNNQLSFREIMPMLLCGMLAAVALTSIYYLISMLVHSKSYGVTAALITAIIFLFSAMIIMSGLNEPEYYEAMNVTYTDEDGNLQDYYTEREKNPYYLEGTKRKIYELLYDCLPGCQLIQITQQNAEHLDHFPLYSLSIIVIITASGVFAFSKKDLK